jgi:hypothetical protein
MEGSKLKKILFFTVLVFFLSTAVVVLAQGDLYVYPRQGQSQQQMEKDKFDCYQWAKQQTGFDPMQQAQATAPPPPKEAPQGGVVRGGARGAALGAVGGAIAGDAGKGAAIGAATGALFGGMRRREQASREQYQQQQWAQQQANNYAQKRSEYTRAYSACLDGKGYTVK